MLIIILYALFLITVWASPSLLTLSRYTYGITTVAHFVTFLASVVLFVLLGRSLKKRRRRRFMTGLFVGALAGGFGTLLGEVIRHSPMATEAFLSQVPQVPPSAAETMLGLHAVASAVLSAAISAVLFALMGAVATWWGGMTKTRRAPAADNPDPVH